MNAFSQKPICVSLPGMEIYLTTYFFTGVDDRPSRMHSHPCYEIVCVKENGSIYFNLIPPLTEHFAKSNADGRVCSFLFTFTENVKDDICQVIRTVNQVRPIQDTFNGMDRLLAINEAFQQKKIGMKEQLMAEFRLFFVKLAQVFYAEGKSEHENTQNLDIQRIALLEDFFNIEMRYPDCNKRQLANKIGVCERQLTRILKEIYNSTFSAILTESRMNMALAMLTHEDMSIKEVAESVGYTSVASFRTAYKKYFGVYPNKN